VYPSIHFLYRQSVGRVAGAYPSNHRAKGGVHPGQVASPSQGHIETNETNKWVGIVWIVGGSRSTRREPTHTRGEHANSTQKGPRRGSNLEPSHCEVTVLTTTPPRSHGVGVGVSYIYM